MHIVRAAQLYTVQIHIRERIDPVKADHLVRAAGNMLRKIKPALEGVVLLHERKRFQFIVSVIRVFHLSRIQQKRIHGSGNLSGHSMPIPAGHVP